MECHGQGGGNSSMEDALDEPLEFPIAENQEGPLEFPEADHHETELFSDAERLEHQTLEEQPEPPVGFSGTEEEILKEFLPLLAPSVSYAPSLRSDFTEDFEVIYSDVRTPVSANYNPDRLVSAAWHGLQQDEPKQVWETGFWNSFFDPNKHVLDINARGFKRPMPFDFPHEQLDDPAETVEKRLVNRPHFEGPEFLKHIKDVPEHTWMEQRESQWETAIRRWAALIDCWSSEACELVRIIQECGSFKEKAQVLVDVFFNKSPQTLLKRVNSLARLTNDLMSKEQTFPCSETDFYAFLKKESGNGALSSRLKAVFEALVFARRILGVAALEDVIASRRCLGAASTNVLSNPRQASPFRVVQLQKLHQVLAEDLEPWNRAMAGMVLFCTYGRSRWSDAQHAEDMYWDKDDAGELSSLEIKTTAHKTARALHLRHMFLPVAAPAIGVVDENWGVQWLHVRQLLGISDLSKYPLMPAPGPDLVAARRALTTGEAKKWLHSMLGPELIGEHERLTSHSCKATCLSFMAKRGVSLEDRLVLGYRSNKLRVGLIYSRDGAARPLALLAHVLMEIRSGIFQPDNTRSG